MINELSKVEDTKQMSRCQLLFYMPIMNHQKQKLRKHSHLQLNKKKYLGINLTKDLKDLYSENYKTLREKLKVEVSGSVYCVHR